MHIMEEPPSTWKIRKLNILLQLFVVYNIFFLENFCLYSEVVDDVDEMLSEHLGKNGYRVSSLLAAWQKNSACIVKILLGLTYKKQYKMRTASNQVSFTSRIVVNMSCGHKGVSKNNVSVKLLWIENT